jgi:hypothetical protein
MLSTKEKEILLKEACRIGDSIVDAAIREGDHVYWETFRVQQEDLVNAASPSLYAGNAGICLFLAHLYQLTRQERYQQAAEKGVDWMYQTYLKQPDGVGFYSGISSGIYCLVAFFELTNENEYLLKAQRLADVLADFFVETDQKENHELMHGASGGLLALLHLYQHLQTDALVGQIRRFAKHILHNLHPFAKGIAWDIEHNQVRPLCGMAHGVAGTATALLCCSHFFADAALLDTAHAAFAYENSWYDNARKNWPDFRIGLFNKENFAFYTRAYIEGNDRCFYENHDTMAWCHGAPGIAMSRLYAYSVTGKKTYLADFTKSIARIEKDYPHLRQKVTLTHCHGIGSFSSLFLMGHKVLGNKKWYKRALQLSLEGVKALHNKNFYYSGFEGVAEEDLSLLNGNAGIGYMLLQLLSPTNIPSFLFPAAENTKGLAKIKLFDQTSPLNQMYQKHYPLTLAALPGLTNWPAPQLVKPLLGLEQQVGAAVAQQAGSDQYAKLLHIYRFEKKINTLKAKKHSSLKLYVRDLIASQKNNYWAAWQQQLASKSTNLVVDSSSTVLYSSMYGYSESTVLPSKQYYILQKKFTLEIKAIPISELVYVVASTFKKPTSLEKGIALLLQKIDTGTNDVATFLRQQIAELVAAGILTTIQSSEAK